MNNNSNAKIIRKLMFTLLPVQILLAVVNAVDNLISSYFASNFLGVNAMSAVGIYNPINLFINAIATILSGGSIIICGKYLGQNKRDELEEVFNLNLALSIFFSIILMLFFGSISIFNQTGFFTNDAVIRPLFNQYLLGQVVGFIPVVMTMQLAAFLSIENQNKRSLIASIVYILLIVVFSYLFIIVLQMKEFGLALASSLAGWVLILIQGTYFISKDASLKINLKKIVYKYTKEIIIIGFPGAASFIYQTIRGLIVNHLLESNVGGVGVSAFAASNDIMGMFWTVPFGMLVVSRLLMSVAIGEEDRTTLVNIMKTMFTGYIPLMLLINALMILGSNPIASLFFRPDNQPIFDMLVSGLRILPLCMSLSIICIHFNCYGQTTNKQWYINILALLDGVVGVVLFSYLLIKPLGINGVYIANVLNGVITTLFIIGYAWYKNKKMPKSVEDLMVIPEEFGVEESNRLDISVDSIEGVVEIAKQIQDFCREKKIDKRRSYLAGLAMEEMAGNIVEHGFTKDNKKHSIDVRVVYKDDDDVILRIKDDCVPFNPEERRQLTDEKDITRNIGIRMIYDLAKDIQYQNILGLNVLTIKI